MIEESSSRDKVAGSSDQGTETSRSTESEELLIN
jgi:hypothetical protein